MKVVHVIPMTVLVLLGLATAVNGQNPTHLQQLLETRACENCDLANSDLRQAHLIGADLRGADLRGANLTQATMLFTEAQEAKIQDVVLTGADIYHTPISVGGPER